MALYYPKSVAEAHATEFGDDADVQPRQVFVEPVVIQRERAREIRHAGKSDQPDAVIRPFLNKILHVRRFTFKHLKEWRRPQFIILSY